MLFPTVVVMILPNVSFRLAYFCNSISKNIASYMYFVTILPFRCLLRAHVFPSTSLVLGMARCARSLFPSIPTDLSPEGPDHKELAPTKTDLPVYIFSKKNCVWAHHRDKKSSGQLTTNNPVRMTACERKSPKLKRYEAKFYKKISTVLRLRLLHCNLRIETNSMPDESCILEVLISYA